MGRPGFPKRLISSLLRLPDEHQGWIFSIAAHGRRILKEHGAGIFMTSGPPMSTHLGGLLLKKMTGARWIADFRDPWTTMQDWKDEAFRSQAALRIERWLERKTVTLADGIVTTAPSVTRYFQSLLPREEREKVITITNGYDDSDFQGLPQPEAIPPGMRLTHAGSLYLGRNPEPIFCALRSLIGKGAIGRSDLQVDFIGDPHFRGAPLSAMVQKYDLAETVSLSGKMGFRECFQRLLDSRGLLLLAQDQPQEIPGKVFEYLRLNKPTLVITDEGDTKDLLRAFPQFFRRRSSKAGRDRRKINGDDKEHEGQRHHRACRRDHAVRPQGAHRRTLLMAIGKEVLVTKPTAAQIPLAYAPEKLTMLLGLFYVWLFMVLDRPQDFFPPLQAIRPALILGCLLLLFFLPQHPAAALKSTLAGKQARLYACLLALMVLDIPFSSYPGRSFHAVFVEQSSNVLLFFFLYSLIDSVAKLKRVLFLAVLGAGLYSVFCLARGTFIDERLFFGEMFDPNDLAFFALTFLPFGCLFLTGEGRLRRLLSAGALVSGTLLIIYSGSRGGFIAFAVVCGLMVFLKNRSITRSIKGILLLAGIPCVVFMLLGAGTSRYSTILNPESDYNYFDESGRLAIWERGIDLMAVESRHGRRCRLLR